MDILDRLYIKKKIPTDCPNSRKLCLSLCYRNQSNYVKPLSDFMLFLLSLKLTFLFLLSIFLIDFGSFQGIKGFLFFVLILYKLMKEVAVNNLSPLSLPFT